MTDEQHKEIVALLTEIRDSLAVMIGLEVECQHPEDHRVYRRTLGGHEEWTCKDCGMHVKDGEVVQG